MGFTSPHSPAPITVFSSEMSQKAVKEGPRLSKNQKFSEHFSIHCCPPVHLPQLQTRDRGPQHSICKSGCFYQKKEEGLDLLQLARRPGEWSCCRPAPGLRVGLCLRLRVPFPALGRGLCKLRFPPARWAGGSPLGSAAGHWRETEGGGAQGCLPVPVHQHHVVQRRATAPACSFFGSSQNQPPRNCPLRGPGASQLHPPRWSERVSQATVPS